MARSAGSRLPKIVTAALRETSELHRRLSPEQLRRIARGGALLAGALRKGRKIIWFGNGGSATQSQHMAGELVGRFHGERRSLPSISLTENMASITAIGNDYTFERIFSRQLEGLAQAGDVAVGLSTSGNSPNVVQGLRSAKTLKLTTIGLTGQSGGRMARWCDLCIQVPSTVTARIQEVHLAIGHIFCALVEAGLKRRTTGRRAAP